MAGTHDSNDVTIIDAESHSKIEEVMDELTGHAAQLHVASRAAAADRNLSAVLQRVAMALEALSNDLDTLPVMVSS